MVDYEWKPTAFEICKVIGRLCKALVEVPTVLVEDMLKIKKKKKKLEGMLSMFVAP
jgi:hypothetical protein